MLVSARELEVVAAAFVWFELSGRTLATRTFISA